MYKAYANGQWCEVRRVAVLELRRGRTARMKRKLRYWFMLAMSRIV